MTAKPLAHESHAARIVQCECGAEPLSARSTGSWKGTYKKQSLLSERLLHELLVFALT